MANNRELSQFASYVEVNDTSKHISIANTTGQYVGIGSTLPTSKIDVNGNANISGNVNISGATTSSSLNASVGSITYLSGTDLNYTGVSTLTSLVSTSAVVGSAVTINSSGVDVTGIVSATYFYQNGTILPFGVGISTVGGYVGSGATVLDFRGSGLSGITYDSLVGIATINIAGGGGGGGGSVSISTEAPSFPTHGDLWYSPVYARTFIYYNEATLSIGSSSYWLDIAPFNQGETGAVVGTAFTAGLSTSPSWYFYGDPQTGVFSPSGGQLTVTSTGSSILNVNPSGLYVTGVVTASNYYDSNGTPLIPGVGISSGGSYVGSGSTVIDFAGDGISSLTVSSGIATVTIPKVKFSPVNYILN